MRKSARERFDSFYRVDESTGCWLWVGSTNKQGYGWFRHDGQSRAHRVSYEFVHGKIPKEIFVCHRCDTPACVNPAHLFAGTHRDNMRDMSKKKRWNSGSGPTHLNWIPDERRDEIRARFESGESAKSIAAHFGIAGSTVLRIVRRLSELRALARKDIKTPSDVADWLKVLLVAYDPRPTSQQVDQVVEVMRRLEEERDAALRGAA